VLGVINARFGTPVRVNVFSGVLFWWLGRRTTAQAADVAPASAQAS